MKAVQIKTEPFQFLCIQNLFVRRKVNQHSILTIQGIIEADLEMDYYNQCIGTENLTFKVAVKEEQSESVFFVGIITKFDLKKEGNLCVLSLEVTSATYLMDLKNHLRFYQEENQPVKEIFEELCNTYPSSNFLMDYQKEYFLKEFTIQYLETDWEFLKRLASRYHQMLLPVDYVEGIHFYVGLNHKNLQEVNEENYTIRNDVQDYYKKSSEMNSHPFDSVTYQFSSREIFFLGDTILFHQQELFVYEIQSELSQGELIHHYKLKGKSGFEIPYYSNNSLIGASFLAEIIEIEKDKVLIKFQDAENKKQSSCKLFSFATIYSTPDGTGWYCMPEPGDTVRLCVPSEKEETAYVVSSVHQKSTNSNARINPDIKSLRTKYGKEIYFTPNSIVMTNHKGNTITLQDDKGIQVESSKDIVIKAVGDISLRSIEQTLLFHASDKINISQGGTQLVVEDDIAFKGGKLRME